MSASTSTSTDAAPVTGDDWPLLPTETEIYLLPDGSVVIADLPMELAAMAAALGAPLPCDVAPPAAERAS